MNTQAVNARSAFSLDRADSQARYLLLVAFVAAALVVRAPAYLYSELNWDEALYRLMADSLLQGSAPYSEIWDRKPVGIFLFVAGVEALFGRDILMLRLATSVCVGISAYLLASLGRKLFPTVPQSGILAGVLYIFYSMLNGGDATNTELIFTPFYLAGALILFRTAARENNQQLVPAFLAGLLAGIALQIKYIVIFDIAAFAAIYAITTIKEGILSEWRRFLSVGLAAGIGIVVPTIAVFLWYIVIGKVDVFLASNIVANESLVGENAPDFGMYGLIVGLRRYDLVFLGTVAALVAGPFLSPPAERVKSWLIIAVWLSAMVLSLWFLQRMADHFFIQTLPALSMASGSFLALAARKIALRPAASAALLAAAMLLTGIWAERNAVSAALETISKRQSEGVAHWGDRTATVAEAVRDRLSSTDEIFIFGRTLGIYAATDRRPPTRLPFTAHLWANYGAVDGTDEINRILARRPAFIVIDDLWLPNVSIPEPNRDRITAILYEALAKDYVLDGKVSKFMSAGGGFVGGSIGVTVYRRNDVAPFQPTPRLQYVAGS